jgi:hypothetical protein
MSQYLYQTRISDHLALTPEGYLIATACVLCRSGTQQYRKSELGERSDSDELVTVNRPVEEVTAPKFLASFPGKSFVVNHPSAGMVNADTHAWSARGTVVRAYVGTDKDDDGNTLILGDIVIHDPTAIRRVLDGQRQLSVGYRYELQQDANGGFEMRNLISNHVALVEAGRAGNAQIMDAALSWGGGVNNETILPGGEGDGPMSAGARKAVAIDEPTAHQELINELTPGGESESEDEIPVDESEETMTPEQLKDAIAEHVGPTMARMNKLCDGLEALVRRRMKSVDPDDGQAEDDALVPAPALSKSERGENPVVDDLRKLRPIVAASGDRKAIDAFNTAMIAAKRGNPAPAEKLLSMLDSTAPTLSWSDMLQIRSKELMEGKLPSEPTDYAAAAREQRERHALDAKAEPEDFTTMIKRFGEKQRNAKHQRG